MRIALESVLLMELLTRFLANLGYVKAEAPRENKPAPTAPISNTAPAISLANKDAEATIVIMAIHQVDEMEGVLFERFLKAVFEQQGYEAELTPFYDWGADLVLQKNGQKTIVQAKRWKTGTAGRAGNCGGKSQVPGRTRNGGDK